MSLILDDSEEEVIVKKWPVPVPIPQDGGGVRTHQIQVDYLLLPQDELDAIVEASNDGDGGSNASVLRRVVKGVYGIKDKSDAAIDFSPDLLDRLIKRANIRVAMMNAYFEMAVGKKGKQKN